MRKLTSISLFPLSLKRVLFCFLFFFFASFRNGIRILSVFSSSPIFLLSCSCTLKLYFFLRFLIFWGWNFSSLYRLFSSASDRNVGFFCHSTSDIALAVLLSFWFNCLFQFLLAAILYPVVYHPDNVVDSKIYSLNRIILCWQLPDNWRKDFVSWNVKKANHLGKWVDWRSLISVYISLLLKYM